MKEKHKAQWEKIRSIGKWKYILIIASITGILQVMLSRLIEYFLFPNNYDPPRLFISLPVACVMGLFYGYISWNTNENRYNNSK